MTRTLTKIMLTICLLLPAFSQGGWQVDPEGSYVGFASVKNELIAENHSFTEITGSVSDEGLASVSINLSSVETLIPIRNERMQSMLFNTAQFPVATVTSQIAVDEYTSLATGESKTINLNLKIDLHGAQLDKSVLTRITRTSDATFEVTSLGPVLVHASQFSLADGVEALRKIAGLQSIDLMVPATFTLKLVRE